MNCNCNCTSVGGMYRTLLRDGLRRAVVLRMCPYSVYDVCIDDGLRRAVVLCMCPYSVYDVCTQRELPAFCVCS